MPAVLEIVKAHNLKNEPLIIDFNSERVEALRKADSEIELWYLVSSIDTEDIDFAKANSTALAFNFGKIRNYTMLDEAKDAGIKLAAWTVDWLPIMDILTAFDVKYITTNRILP
jgi:glycerophosphoryl diester phosphodiesterase